MKTIYIVIAVFSIVLVSCGKSGTKKTSSIDTTSIDTAGVEQLEKELKDLESQSNRVNEKLDSINNVINE